MPVAQFVYTALPLGKGYNPSLSGYQIQACSASLSAEQREWLGSLCMHYGDTVYRAAPQEAIEKETTWRTRADDPRIFPSEVLEAFPETLSYSQLDENHYALTRVKYTGLTYDNRPGNFLAYTLVFAPGQLQEHLDNALLAVRSGILDYPPSGDDGDGLPARDLPELPDLSKSKLKPDFSILALQPYRTRLAQMITALVNASPQARPVILHIANWREAPRVVEALLHLLPAEMRRRTTFCTYESDRNWLPTVRGQRPTGMQAAHHILVLGGRDAQSVSLRPDEIQNRFVVFNFMGDQFSPVSESDFATWAADCVLQNRFDQLETFYRFLDQLGFSQQPQTWESLAVLFDLDRLEQVEERTQKIERFASLAVEHHKAAEALAWIEQRIVEWAGKRDLLSLQAARPAINRLITAIPAENTQRQAYLLHVRSMAEAEIKKGQVQAASVLLQLTGDERQTETLVLLKHMLVEKTISLPDLGSMTEKERWLDLLFDGLAAAEAHPDLALPTPLMVDAIFQAAQAVNRTSETWNRLGKSVILPYLKGEWNREKQAMAANLLKTLDPKENPDVVVDLGLRMAAQPGLSSSEWSRFLQAVCLAAGQTTQPEAVIEKVVQHVDQRSLPAEEKAVVLALLVEPMPAGRGREKLARACEYSLAELKPGQRNSVRRELAKAQSWSLLSQEFFNEVLAMDEQERKKALQQWRDVLFVPYPDFLDKIFGEMAARIQEKGEPARELQDLAVDLLPRDPQKPLKPGLTRLYEALVMKYPLTPSESRKPSAFHIPEGISPQASQRSRIIVFLESIQQQSRQEGWTLEKFPNDQSAWAQDVRALSDDEKVQVIGWVLSTFSNSGITQAGQARAMVKMLHNVGMLDALGEALAGLLHGRDAVSWVLAGAAMVDYGVKFPKTEEGAKVASLALASFDKNQLNLLEEHLWKRFAQPDRRTQEKLAELCTSLGLAIPKAFIETSTQPEDSKKSGKQPETSSPGGTGAEQAIKKSAGMFSKIGGLFQSSDAKKSKKENGQ